MTEDLAVGERQRVEIIKVLYRGARILILDEPTAVLVPQEVEELFDNLRELKAQGVTIIFISHKLDEVLEIADSITVIRAGTHGGHGEARGRDGPPAGRAHGRQRAPDARDAGVDGDRGRRARACATSGVRIGERWALESATFDIHRGEVVGIAGVEGNGQRELVEALMGLRKPSKPGRSLWPEPT